VPVPFVGPQTEVEAIGLFLDEQRAALLRKLDGLSDAQATSHPTASDFCLLTIVKHVAFTERRWFLLEVAGRDVPGLWPPPDDRELRVEPEDTVASVRALYESVIEENRSILASLSAEDLDVVGEHGVNPRWVLFHLIEEVARHAGHADIIRESIDGSRGA
jgi:hypothetical protein